MHLNNEVNEQTVNERSTKRGLNLDCIASYKFQFELAQRLKKTNC